MKDDMTCGFDKGLLAAHYDGETTAEECAQVERHVAGCPECARDLASMKDLSAALKPLARASAPMSIAEGVMREIRPAAPAPRRWVQWSVSAAAAILFAVGTVMILNRETALSPRESLAVLESKKKASPDLRRAEESRSAPDRFQRNEPSAPREADGKPHQLGAGFKEAEKDAPRPSAAPPSPQAEAPAKGEDRSGIESETRKDLAESDDKAERKEATAGLALKAPAVPVVRVSSADVAAARAAVEAFLAERKVKWAPGAPLLGKGEFVENHYLQLDLTAEETSALRKRLAELKETALANGTFEDEKKRVAKELAKAEALARKKEQPAADEAAKAGKEAQAEAESPARGRAGALSPEPPRKKIIFVFEPLPKK